MVGRSTAFDRTPPIWITCDRIDTPSSASSFFTTAPAATLAAVSRALARSSTSRASVKPYFCMPTRSAWPGPHLGERLRGDARRGRHLGVPLVAAEPLAVLDLDGDRRAQRAAVADTAEQREIVLLELLARPAAVAEPPASHLGLDLLDRDRQPGGQALDDHDESLAVRFAGGEVTQASAQGYWPRDANSRSAAAHITVASGVDAGPQLLLQHGLMHQHAEALHGLRAGGARPLPEVPCGAGGRRCRRRPGRRATDRHHTAGPSVPMPTEVALTTTSQSATSPGVAHGSDRTGQRRPRREPCSAERLTTITSATPAASDGVDDRARRRAATEHADALAGEIHSLGSEPRHEPGAVGAVALEAAVAERHHGVDAAQRPPPPDRDRRRERRPPPCAASSPRGRRTRARASRRAPCLHRPAPPRTRRTPSRRRSRRTQRCAAPARGCGGRDCR